AGRAAGGRRRRARAPGRPAPVATGARRTQGRDRARSRSGAGAMSDAPPDTQALLRSREYLKLLVLAAIIGAPISAIAYGFLELVHELQHAFYVSVPKDLGLDPVPSWWPAPLLALGGLVVALAIQRLPGTGGHSPA